jgi:hypothetical protein
MRRVGGWPTHTLGAPSVTSFWSRVGCECDGLRYRHAGPMVEKPEDWPWSSFRHHLTGVEGRIEIESHWTWSRREGSSPHP